MNNRGFTWIEVIVAPMTLAIMLGGLWLLANIVGHFLPDYTPNVDKVRNEAIQFENSPKEDYWQNNAR